ncbi:MAG TPA: biopolymer transporter ExbD [Vicinamibacteria bacterium]|nr:biopolymer transporter ExbD [Vicinamibacteria bacterium]
MELERRLRSAFETQGDRTLFVKAEGHIPYDRVVAVVDIGRGAGASRIGLLDDVGGVRR